MPVLILALVASMTTVSIGAMMQMRVQKDVKEKQLAIQAIDSAYATEMTALQTFYTNSLGGAGGPMTGLNTNPSGGFSTVTLSGGPGETRFAMLMVGTTVSTTGGGGVGGGAGLAGMTAADVLDAPQNDYGAQGSLMASNFNLGTCSVDAGTGRKLCEGVNIAGTLAAHPVVPRQRMRGLASVDLVSAPAQMSLAAPSFPGGVLSCGRATMDGTDQTHKTCIAGNGSSSSPSNSCGNCKYQGIYVQGDTPMRNDYLYLPNCDLGMIRINALACPETPNLVPPFIPPNILHERKWTGQVDYLATATNPSGFVKSSAVGSKQFILKAFNAAHIQVGADLPVNTPGANVKQSWSFPAAAGVIRTIEIEFPDQVNCSGAAFSGVIFPIADECTGNF